MLGKRKVAAVEREHIERLHAAISRRAPVLANRGLAIVASMFGKAVGLVVDRPAEHRKTGGARGHPLRRA